MSGWKELQRLHRRELKALQNRLLHEFVTRRLYPFSDWYRKLFDERGIRPAHVRRVEDLADLPFTNKQDLMPTDDDPQRPRRFILTPSAEAIRAHWPLPARLPLLFKGLLRGKEHVRAELRDEYYPIFMTFTTGRSAQPLPFLYSRHDLDVLHDSGARLADVLGFAPEWKVLNLFPYAPHLAFWQVSMAGFAKRILVLGTGGGRVAGTEGNLRALARMQPEVLVGVPGYLYHLLRAALSARLDVRGLEIVVFGADRVPPGLKTKMRELLAELGSPQVKVCGTYGFTEARMAFAECPTADNSSTGYHFYPDRCVFEIIDPVTGEVLPHDADGELVFTPLTGRGTTVLRYRTGDIVTGGISLEPCPVCRRTLPRINSKLSRASSVTSLDLMKVKGTLVNVEELGSVLAGDLSVEEWQVEIRKKDNDPHEVDELVLYISLRGEADADAVRTRIASRIKAATELSPNEIHVLPTDSLLHRVGMENEMKERRFVDTRVRS